MKAVLFALLTCFAFSAANAQLTPFELSKDKNYTATYPEIIAYYKKTGPCKPANETV